MYIIPYCYWLMLGFVRYVEGRVSQVEADEKLADYIDGRNWKDYVGRKTEFYIFTVREGE